MIEKTNEFNQIILNYKEKVTNQNNLITNLEKDNKELRN